MEDNLNNIFFPNKLVNKEKNHKKSIQEVYKTERNIINDKISDLVFCKKNRPLKNNMNYQKIFNLVNGNQKTVNLNNSQNNSDLISIRSISNNDFIKLEKNFRISAISNSLDKRILESNISTEFKFSEIKMHMPKTTYLSQNQKIIKTKDNLNLTENNIRQNSPDFSNQNNGNNKGDKIIYKSKRADYKYRNRNSQYNQNGINFRIKTKNPNIKPKNVYDANGNEWDTFRVK